jgi:hypothetical protein
MAKGFARPVLSQSVFYQMVVLGLTLFALSACSKKEAERSPTGQIEGPISFPITSSKLENCRFKNPAPTYAFNSSIEANTILCDEGVPTKVELLTPNPLPNGIEFSMNQNLLGLTGTAKERVIGAPYEFYLENEAGYQIIKLTLTVK